VPWTKAVALVGSEARLVAGRDHGTVNGYRKHGVPIQEIGHEVLAALSARTGGPLIPREDILLLRDFAARVAGYKQLRRVILALADCDTEAKMFDRAMRRAEELEQEGLP